MGTLRVLKICNCILSDKDMLLLQYQVSTRSYYLSYQLATMAEVKQISMQNEWKVCDNVEPGNDYTKATSNHKSRRKVITTLWMISIIMWNIIWSFLVIGALASSIYAILDKNHAVSDPWPLWILQLIVLLLATITSLLDGCRIRTSPFLSWSYIGAAWPNLHQIGGSLRCLECMQLVQSVIPTDELNLYAGCAEYRAECTLDHTDVERSIPDHTSCNASPLDLNVEGFTNTDFYWYIDNSATVTNPIYHLFTQLGELMFIHTWQLSYNHVDLYASQQTHRVYITQCKMGYHISLSLYCTSRIKLKYYTLTSPK